MKGKIGTATLLFLILSFTLFFRTYFCYDKVFSEPIKYAADDGVYHMRLIENTLLGHHFPRRIRFDPYTYFPKGTYIPFPPLFDQLFSGIIWLVSLGRPSLELINKIGPFYPPVLGSLTVFLVYFLTKAVYDDKKVALLSAFLTSIYPPFLFKSLLGAADHHVAEVLFSSLTMMFLVFLLKLKNNKPSFFKNKRFWLLTILTGISLGLYFLTWNGALLFLFIIFIFIVLYYLIEYLKGNSSNWLLLAGIIIFLITLLTIFPFLGHPDLLNDEMFNIKHLEALVFGISGLAFIYIATLFIKKRNLRRLFLPPFLFLGLVLLLLILKLFTPVLLEGLIKSFQGVSVGLVPHKMARQLISEMAPLGLGGTFSNFSTSFYLALISLAIILYRFIKNNKAEYLLLFVWSAIMIFMAGVIPFWGQGRFAYYLSVNIAILSSFIVVRGFEFGWRSLRLSQSISLRPSVRAPFIAGSLLIIFDSIFFLIFPFPLYVGSPYPDNLPDIFKKSLLTAKIGPYMKHNDWYMALAWLRKNTPDPLLDYYALYYEPGINKNTGKIEPYSYPRESYGVLARWDVGHMITYYAHRMPHSNPFQQGIGRKEEGEVSEIGAEVFFLETEERKAIEYLEKLNTRYIITDYELVTDVFPQAVMWVQGDLEGYLEGEETNVSPSKFDNSMLVRLHILDGQGKITKREVRGEEIEFYIEPLDQFRLVYESSQEIVFSTKEPVETSRKVKIFEYVKGAKIKGRAEKETVVVISTEIETNQRRKFVFQKEAVVENGYFEFTVPYSTFGKEGRLEGETQFDVFAKPYQLKIGEKKVEVEVTERDILKGGVIEVSL